MRKGAKKLSLLVFILGVFLIVTGSYAIYRGTYTGEDDNKIVTDSASLEFLESNTNVINIPNAIPMSDEEGKTQSDAFDFAVTSKTSKNQNISYSIVLEKLQDDQGRVQLSDKEVKVYLTDFDGNELLLSNVSDISKDYVLYTKTNNHNSTNNEIKDKYKLRVWIDEKNTNIDFNKENDITYAFKLGVKTNVSETDTEQTYVVNYNSNGGTGTMESTTFKQGETKKLSKNTFTKDGYTFKGWSINNSKDVVYTDEEEVKNLTNVYNGKVNLYAIWEKEIVTYHVRYNANGGTGEMINSSFTTGTKSKLSKNEYKKEGYIFKGWSTTLNGEVKYKDEEEVEDLTLEKDKIIDLYAVWEVKKYTVNVVVKDGIVDGEASKIIDYNNNATFNISPTNDKYVLGSVECTNNQKGTFGNNVLIVSNVTNNTTCTVSYVTEKTTLYTDGTLIINEQLKNRNANIEKYGEVIKDYEAMSASNSYVFTYSYSNSAVNSPWFSEREQIKSVEIGATIRPISTAYWFFNNYNMVKGDFTNLDTSSITNMSSMFSSAGKNATTWSIGDLSAWDTSQVTSMRGMFLYAGSKTTTWNIGDLSGWDTSKVTDMGSMFWYAGENATTWSVGDLSNWNTSKVTDMSHMFSDAGKNVATWSVGDLSSWKTSNVTDMSDMFKGAGSSATTFNLDLSNWDTSKVTDMGSMFWYAGSKATTWSVGDLSNWDTSNVKSMRIMFGNAGINATMWNIGNLSNWDTSNVTDMYGMFWLAGSSATTFNLNLSNWNTSNVTTTEGMFYNAGRDATTWSIGELSNWDTSNVTNMSDMFWNASSKTVTFSLDLSSWNTSNVTDMSDMFNSTGYNATTWTVKIPSTTGSLTNTTSKWYGSSSSTYAEPLSGKSFTLS